jgi:hypothetical protein
MYVLSISNFGAVNAIQAQSKHIELLTTCAEANSIISKNTHVSAMNDFISCLWLMVRNTNTCIRLGSDRLYDKIRLIKLLTL